MGNNKRYFHNKKPAKVDNYAPPFPDTVLAEPVSNLSLREETLTLLVGANVNTLGDLLKRTETDFYKICKFNKKNLFDVKNAIKKRNLFLKPLPVAEPQGDTTGNKPNNGNNRPQQNQQKNERTNNQQGQRPNQQNAKQNQQNAKQNQQGNKQNNQKQNQKSPKANEKLVLLTVPEKPPRPVHTVIKDEPDIYVKINKGGKWGFRGRDDKDMVIPAIYDEVFNFKEDLCCVELNEKFGFIDRKGEEVIPIEYDCATSFSEGYACVFKKDLCGYINKQNETVIDFKYTAGTPVINGECRVKSETKWGELHLDNPNEIRWIN